LSRVLINLYTYLRTVDCRHAVDSRTITGDRSQQGPWAYVFVGNCGVLAQRLRCWFDFISLHCHKM